MYWKKIALQMEKQGIKNVVELADKAKLPASTIYTWKQEYEKSLQDKSVKPTTPTVDSLQKVAKALNVGIAELL